MLSIIKKENKKLKIHIKYLEQELKKAKQKNKKTPIRQETTSHTLKLANILNNHFC